MPGLYDGHLSGALVDLAGGYARLAEEFCVVGVQGHGEPFYNSNRWALDTPFRPADMGLVHTDIGVMKPDGTGERILTTGWEDEGPTWAPNGRVLMFTRTIEGGRGAQIWSVDITGRNERRVATPGDASDPAWSSLIQ